MKARCRITRGCRSFSGASRRFPAVGAPDVIREALTEHLKTKGYLE